MQDYTKLKKLFAAGAITSFEDFFHFISIKEFCQDTGISYARLQTLRQLPAEMTVSEIMNISAVTGLDPDQFGVFIIKNYLVRMQ